jgi:hypothetical protein
MIPNIALDNTVDKHVKALALFGATDWEVNGRKYRDWITRKEYVFNFDKSSCFWSQSHQVLATRSSQTRTEESKSATAYRHACYTGV